jgi:hypothetical protein
VLDTRSKETLRRMLCGQYAVLFARWYKRRRNRSSRLDTGRHLSPNSRQDMPLRPTCACQATEVDLYSVEIVARGYVNIR